MYSTSYLIHHCHFKPLYQSFLISSESESREASPPSSTHTLVPTSNPFQPFQSRPIAKHLTTLPPHPRPTTSVDKPHPGARADQLGRNAPIQGQGLELGSPSLSLLPSPSHLTPTPQTHIKAMSTTANTTENQVPAISLRDFANRREEIKEELIKASSEIGFL